MAYSARSLLSFWTCREERTPVLGQTGRGGLGKTLNAVFVVHHEYQHYDDRDETKLIGVYSTEAKAKLAIERLRVLPGFSEYPDGFSVDCYPIDADHWIEGLVQQ
jgi:hypothetical protein